MGGRLIARLARARAEDTTRGARLFRAPGQVPIDPETGAMIEGDFKSKVHQVFKNLSAILERAESDLSKVVKFTVFITDMSNYAEVNEVFNEWLDEESAPARSLVSVKELPGGADVEIECIAFQ